MLRFAGACRFMFNKALALQTANHAAGNKFTRYEEMANLLPVWKVEFPQLREASQALQHSLKNLDRAFTNFFEKRTEFPRFRETWLWRQIPFPARVQTGSGQLQGISAEAGLGSLPEQPGSCWHGQERHRQQPQRQMVRLHPDPA